MITVIRNDHKARFAHDIYGVKIKEELPNYKLIGCTRNEGICIYESPNYGAVARTFDIIVEAIRNGEKSILIIPPVVKECMTKEQFVEECDVHDFCPIDDDHPIPPGHDMYGRKIPPVNECKGVYEQPQPYSQEFYAWDTPESTLNPLGKNSYNNKFLDNIY